MIKIKTENLRIARIDKVINPKTLSQELPITAKAAQTTQETREQIYRILNHADDRLVVIVGPCSIHDPQAAIEYADRLKSLLPTHINELLIVMRVYFEKPRTTIGWKGLINDPDLNGSFNITKGLYSARKLLLEINHLGIPAGTEFLDIITPQYVTDLIAWGAIGARTTESQVHRELVSGLSCPMGFKNGTNGNLDIAVDAICAATKPHHFLSLTRSGHAAIYTTTGNNNCHIILRGGKQPNYGAGSIDIACRKLVDKGLPQHVMVDFSHSNSKKIPQNQIKVGKNICRQLANGNCRIIGVMVESHLIEGQQNITNNTPLTYGQSITDACLGWDETESLLGLLADAVRRRRKMQSKHIKNTG